MKKPTTKDPFHKSAIKAESLICIRELFPQRVGKGKSRQDRHRKPTPRPAQKTEGLILITQRGWLKQPRLQHSRRTKGHPINWNKVPAERCQEQLPRWTQGESRKSYRLVPELGKENRPPSVGTRTRDDKKEYKIMSTQGKGRD